MEEIQTEQGKSFAAPLIFILVFAFHFLSKYIESSKNKKGSGNNLDVKLREEIKQLLKEASSLSQPSTFAQAAKLRRTAAAKEKELAKYLETQEKDIKLSFISYGKHLMMSKTITYFVLILWFWKVPVATISDQLVQPFGRLLSWRAGNSLKDSVVVGIIPWLVVSTRVSKFICRKKMEQNFFTRLPSDITIDILSRLPAPHIVRCKCVCKSWRDLIKSPEFVKPHLSKSIMGLAWFSRPSLASFIHEVADDNNCEDYRMSIEFVSPAKIESSVDGLLFHCDSCDSLYLSNPVTRDLIRVPSAPPSPQVRPHMFGFGLSKTSRQYKIVRISLSLDQPECDVYTVGTRWWRRVRTRIPVYRFYKRNGAPFLNGVVHWLVFDVKRCMHISCFDLETEAFTTLSPRHVFDTFCGKDSQSLSALEGCLCLCDSGKGGEIVIWLMKEYGNDESWTKEFIIKMELMESRGDFGYLFVPVKVFRNGDLLVVRMRKGSGKVFCYSTKTKRFEIKHGLYVNGNVVICTPSFVPVKPISYPRVGKN